MDHKAPTSRWQIPTMGIETLMPWFRSIRQYIIQRAFTGVLLLACVLFAMDDLLNWKAQRGFDTHVSDLASSGGGTLFVFQPADCVATRETAAYVAGAFGSAGIQVQGLVIRGTVEPAALRLVLDAANERFPHEDITARAATTYMGRAGTPVVFVIGSDRQIVAMERFGGIDLAGAGSLADRLLAALGT